MEESPNIKFEAKARIIRSAKAVEEAQDTESKKKNPKKGKRFYAEAKLKPGASWPTREAWLKKRAEGSDVPEDTKSVSRAQEAEARAELLMASNPEAQRILAEFEERSKGH